MVRSRSEVLSLRKKFADRYRIFWLESSAEGCAGYELCTEVDGPDECVCRILYWDAVGQYFVELPKGEITALYLLKLLLETVERVGVPMDDSVQLNYAAGPSRPSFGPAS